MGSILLGLLTGGGSFLLSLLGTIAPRLAASIGDIFIRYKQTEASRERGQDASGVKLGGSWLSAVTDANRSRADARKAEGTWGPLGIVTLMVGLIVAGVLGAFGYHTALIVLDSTPWSVFGLFEPHVVGSWRVAPLPPPFDQHELAALKGMVDVIQALFYTAPPAAAAVAVAKVFRR